jgi:hypothetical protein
LALVVVLLGHPTRVNAQEHRGTPPPALTLHVWSRLRISVCRGGTQRRVRVLIDREGI